MYEAFYGLKEKPFRNSPDPRFLYLSPQHEEVLSKCLYMVRGRIGPTYVYGPAGVGKTSIARRLYERLADTDDGYVVTSITAKNSPTADSLLNSVALEFGVEIGESFGRTMRNLASFLKRRPWRTDALIIDDAEKLSSPQLQLLHSLLKYEIQGQKLLVLVCFGDNELASHIAQLPSLANEMFPTALTPLNAVETAQMIQFRLNVAGSRQWPFTVSGSHEIYRLSRGLPRDACRVADAALKTGFKESLAMIDVPDVSRAARALEVIHPKEVYV